jgi:hypothetical protein
LKDGASPAKRKLIVYKMNKLMKKGIVSREDASTKIVTSDETEINPEYAWLET